MLSEKVYFNIRRAAVKILFYQLFTIVTYHKGTYWYRIEGIAVTRLFITNSGSTYKKKL